MSRAEEVLTELRRLGAVGVQEGPRRRTLEEVVLDEPPACAPVQGTGVRTAELFDRLAHQLRSIAASAEALTETAAQAAETIEALSQAWAADDSEDDEEEEDEEEDDTESDAPVEKVAEVAPIVKDPPVVSGDIQAMRASIRRRVRGEDLSPAALAQAYGEAPVEDDVPSVVPLGNLNFTPSYPSKEK